jgi:aryl-alcohol dehydrogenase-like predicted oxidoreductase
MRYRVLGKSGVRISEVALGTMTFGDDWGWGRQAHAVQAPDHGTAATSPAARTGCPAARAR